MSYDPNSIEAQIGVIGEKIAYDTLFLWDYDVQRGDEHGEKSLMDFFALPKNPKRPKRYVEVKVRRPFPYAYGQYPCYSFPVVQIEAYERFTKEKGIQGELWIIDPIEKVFRVGYLGKVDDTETAFFIETKQFIDGKEFPFDQDTKKGRFRFFHQMQFGEFPINVAPESMLDELKELYIQMSAKQNNPLKINVFSSTDCPAVETEEVSEPKQEETTSAKSLVEKLAAFVNIGKADLTQSILDLRQKKFDREQAQMKELLL